MGLLSSGRLYRQKAVYWSFSGTDDNGQPVYDEARVIKVRWEDRTEEFLDSAGNRQISQSVVYIPEDLALRGYLKLTSVPSHRPDNEALAEIEDLVYPDKNEGAWQIRRLDIIPTLRRPDVKLRIAIL
jgi:hypothetical protein